MALIGPHIDPPLAEIPGILRANHLTVFQTTLRDPRRLSKEGVPGASDVAAFLSGAGEPCAFWGIAHASMLTSLGSPDPRIRNGSAGALVSDASLAAAIGLAGVCFHVGYQKGHPTRQVALDAVARKLVDVLSRLPSGARVLLENGCEGTELGQTVAELGAVVRAVGASPDGLGIVLDTCHLHVAGFDMADREAAERLAAELDAEGLLPYMTALHLNDAREACGSHRDRHTTPGQGTIADGLVRLIAHPAFAPLPAIIEVGFEEALLGLAFLTSGEK